VLALIFGHAPWAGLDSSRQADRLGEVVGFYAQNAVIKGWASARPGALVAALVHLELYWGERTQIFCVDDRKRVGARGLSERFAPCTAASQNAT
jgi:hypothetical protein